MWTTLRSDLREFVSTVAEESTSALAAIDSQLSAADEGQLQKKENKEVGVILNDDGNITYVDAGDESGKQEEDRAKRREFDEMLNELERDKNTYIVELTEEEALLKEQKDKEEENGGFLKEEILKQKSHVEEIYKEIVIDGSTISEEEFWARYYVRCYIPYQANTSSASSQHHGNVDAAGATIMSGLFKFMEGAAKQLDHHRPPFVLNTAVDDDDEDDYGWDDDDDDDEDEEESSASQQATRDTLIIEGDNEDDNTKQSDMKIFTKTN